MATENPTIDDQTTTEAGASLECSICGCEAIFAGADGLFYESDIKPCLSCGYPGEVVVYDDGGDDDDDSESGGSAHWREADETDPAVAAWRAKYPLQAAELDARSHVSTLPSEED